MRAAGVKRLLVGRALPSHKMEHQLLPRYLALPVFASDPLSSVAYATEEMMLVLIAAGAAALAVMVPLGLAIAALLAIVVTSYRQTVRAYPRGGGSYIVSRENLGTIPGLVAAAAILADYVLTVAVSVTAGTIAITSAAPSLAEHRVGLAVGFVALLTLANLRGVREAGRIFAVPTYGFVVMVYLTLLVGFARCLTGCPPADSSNIPIVPLGGLGAFLVLRAFASGATALTGVEAIADGVQAFRRPQSRNAASTLAIMGGIATSMFLGITVLARLIQVRVTHDIASSKSVLAQIGETVFGRGSASFFLLQAFTAGILILAANTSYQDFPRLSSILARDHFMPAQFRNRGDRLVFSNGVVVLALLASVLIWLFDASLTRLIQLYVVGVFTAFTLSQTGMVRRWARLRSEGWRRSMVINGVGAVTTGIVLVIVAITKFTHGAWIVIAAIPVIVAAFLAVHHHYEAVGRMLRARGGAANLEAGNRFVVVVPDLGLATVEAITYLRAIRPAEVLPLYIGPPERFEETAREWSSRAPRLGTLEALPVENGSVTRSLRRYLHTIARGDEFITVVVPETLSSHSVFQFVRSRATLFLKTALLFEPGIVITNCPLLPEERAAAALHEGRPLEPERSVVLVPVSAVHDATLRALAYAKSLQPAHLEALYFASDPEEVDAILRQWADWRVDVPLSVVDAPFRDIKGPLLQEIRRHTAHHALVTVVLPEFVVRRWWEHLLHNQTGLYIKRFLLFEPHTVVTSVPVRLEPPRAGRPREDLTDGRPLAAGA